jgi:uncharacterized protein (TIGR02145 family)
MKQYTIFVLFIFLFTGLISAQSIVAYYPFNGNANDVSGNNINPTYIGTGVTLTTDRFGNANKAYYFDGTTGPNYSITGSYMRLPANALPAGNRTISLWFNTNDVSNRPGLLGYGGNGSCGTTLLMGLNVSGAGQFHVQGHCGNNTAAYAYGSVPINNWYHWVLTIDGSTQKIYVNGVLKSTDNTFSGTTATAGVDFALGAITHSNGLSPYTDVNVGFFQGKLDDVRIYDSAMTDAQVMDLYANESMVAYYPFNGNANDESGNGYNGSVNGATITSDRFNEAAKAYNFTWNGTSSDKIQIPGTSSLNFNSGGFSISAWFKFSGTSYNGYNYPIVSKHVCSENSGYILMLYNNKLTFWTGGTGWSGYLSTTDSYVDGNWYHAVATYDGTTRKIYVNGILKASDAVAYTSINAANIALGGYNGCNGGFNGKLDDIRVYYTSLSDAQVMRIYKSESPELVAYYPFNGNANDQSIWQNHGTVHNAVLTTDRFGADNKAYSFSNPNHITVPYNPHVFTDSFTLSYWFKIPSYFGERAVLSNVAQPSGGFQQWLTGQTFQYLLGYNFPNWFWANYSMQSPVSQWHQAVLTYRKTGSNSSETKLYINGDLKMSDQHAQYISFTSGATLYIGQNHSGLNFQGDLDDVKVYSRILTNQEILQNYENEVTCSDASHAVISSPYNAGAGTLRAALSCIESGGTVTWSPTTNSSVLTAPLAVDKNVNIIGSDPVENPEIIIDLLNSANGFNFSSGAELNLSDVDIIIRNHSDNKAITEGNGTLNISGITKVEKELYPFGTVHCNPYNPTEIIEVTNPVTGRTWMDRNLGAIQVATNSTDAAAYGDLYQWGRFSDGHQCRNSGITDILSTTDSPGHNLYIIVNLPPTDWRSPQNNNLWQIPVNVNNPCPIGYRLPTIGEFEEERNTWTGTGAQAAFNSSLKLTLAGGRNTANGNLHTTNDVGYYWTNDSATQESNILFFYGNTISISPFNRGFGASIRCIKN